MKIFTSPHRAFAISFGDGVEVQFNKSNMMGVLALDEDKDADLIKRLLQHPDYGKRFTDKKTPAKEAESNIVVGIRSSVNVAAFEKQEQNELVQKFREYDSIKNKVLKLDGTQRVEADPELVIKFNQLKAELNL